MVDKSSYFAAMRARFVAARTARLGWLCALLTLLLGVSCSQVPATPLPAITGLAMSLEDEVRDLPNGQIAWSTYWKLCWDNYPNAEAYELQALTGEGATRRLRRQSERCFRLQAAAGENSKAQGLLNRSLQLALQQGQLAYRVRAMSKDGRASEWSAPFAVGKGQ